jgi:predicted transcriptional regulator YheO
MAMLCINAKLSIGGRVARRGRPIAPAQGRKGKRISFLLKDEVYRPLAHHCIDADTTIQAFVVAAIREKLARETTSR